MDSNSTHVRRLATFISLSFLFWQCALSSDAVIDRINHVPESDVAMSLSDSLKRATPAPLTKGDVEERELSHDDPIIQLKAEPAVRSNYQLFSFTGHQGEKISISATSLCACAGLKKEVMVPLVFVFKPNGDPVKEDILNYTDLPADNTRLVGEPFRKRLTWSGAVPTDGKYYVLVAADNSAPGEDAGDVTLKTRKLYKYYYRDGSTRTGYGDVMAGGLFQAKSRPTGAFRILLE